MTSTSGIARVLGITLFALLVGLLPSKAAYALSIFASDCSTDFKNVFFDNEPVCAFGDSPGGSVFGAPGLACVVPVGGQPADDVTAGGCNAVPVLASFWEEFLWLPPTTPGTYQLIIVNNQGSVASDTITIVSSGGAAPTVNVAAIKQAAANSAGGWQVLADYGHYIDEYAGTISLAWSLGTGDVLGAAVAAFGLVTGQATDYNGAVLDIGGQIISALAGQQAARYTTLANDPPDPNYTDVVALDIAAVNADLAALENLYPAVPLAYPYTDLINDPRHNAQTELANAMAEETALVFALMRTLEKYQGAEDADDDQYILLQASALKRYADQLTGQIATTRQLTIDNRTLLDADGAADVAYDGDAIANLITRLQTSGLTAAEEQSLRDVGFDDATLQVLFDRINTLPLPPSGNFTPRGAYDSAIAASDQFLAALQDLGSQAQEVIDHYTPLVTIAHPTADAGGPYNADVGVAINLDGSASSDPQAQPLFFEWDLDLDGDFGDGAGQVLAATFNETGTTKVGLRVVDTDGNADIAYATVTVSASNGGPQITFFEPADVAPTASNLSPLDFSAAATDPESDPLSFEWQVNGVVVSSANAFTYTPDAGATGTSNVRLTVSDGNPLSLDAVETRVVLLLDEVSVPDVVGLTQVAAEAAITGARLTVGAVTNENSDTVPAGEVISQAPDAGSVVLADAAVDFVLSAGPADIAVPAVVGETQADAELAITGIGLTVGAVTAAFDPVVPEGSVVSQNPLSGTNVAPGTAVALVVSLGPDTDDDGVGDALDLCPGTPAGEAVDADGCAAGQLDEDGDGVTDTADLCPATPAGEAVDADGCSASQLDDDNDGVSNAADLCPGTPAGEAVDADGCSASQTDGDGDGVDNAADLCPGTPAGEAVDADGCSASQLDDDNDGVSNAADLCPGTPAGAAVDADGCAATQLDADGDGVSDAADLCPGTPVGAAVNADGCAPGQLDEDSDGISDADDACPGTPAGEAVDASGCSDSQIGGIPGDVDGDGDVDRDDIAAITAARNTAAAPGDPRDLDEDGVITVLDARKAVLNCTNPGCGPG